MTNQKDNFIGVPNSLLQATYTIFDKAVVLNYKKCGTRFFAHMAAYPHSYWDRNNHQYDLTFLHENVKSENDDGRNYLNLDFGTYYTNINFTEDGHIDTATDCDSFYKNYGVSDINEFVLNNPKDLYVVIRNPIDRFLSGLVQILATFVHEQIPVKEEVESLQRHIDISDTEIENIKENFNKVFNQRDDDDTYENMQNNLDYLAISKIFNYILKHNPNWYLQDMHTQNCLNNIKELIYNNKNKDKIKIISLEDCKTKNALNLFNSWNEKTAVNGIFRNINNYVISNKRLYDSILKYDYKEENLTIIREYLRIEFADYQSMMNSKMYFKF